MPDVHDFMQHQWHRGETTAECKKIHSNHQPRQIEQSTIQQEKAQQGRLQFCLASLLADVIPSPFKNFENAGVT